MKKDPIIINCTPHPIKLMTNRGVETFYPSPAHLTRNHTEQDVIGQYRGTPILRSIFTACKHLPIEQSNTYYLVSTITRVSHPDRKDLLSPGSPVRNEKRQILYATTLEGN